MGTWRGCSPRSVPSHIGGATRLWLVLALALAAAVGGCGGAERDEAVEVKALWYGTAADGTTVGGTAPVEIRAVEDDPRTPLSLDVGGLRAAGAGPMWTAATAVAEVQAVLVSGVDPRLHQLRYSLHEAIDGPSAGALLTVGTLAALRGASVPPSTTVTGTVLPDGSIGPVGGVAEKIRAAQGAGITRVLIPSGQTSVFDTTTGAAVDPVRLGRSAGVEVVRVKSVPDAYALITRQPVSRSTRPAPPIRAGVLQMLARRSRALIATASRQARDLDAGPARTQLLALTAAAEQALARENPVRAFAAAAEAAQLGQASLASARLRNAARRTSLAELAARVSRRATRSLAEIRAQVRVTAEQPVTKTAQLPALADTLAWGAFAMTSINVAQQRLRTVGTQAELDEIVRFLEVARFEAATYMPACAESLLFIGTRAITDMDETVSLVNAYTGLIGDAADANRTYADSLGLRGSEGSYLGQLLQESHALGGAIAPGLRTVRGPTALPALRLSIALLEYVETTQLVNDLTARERGRGGGPPNLAAIKDAATVRSQAQTAAEIARSEVRTIAAAGLDPSFVQWNSQWGAELAFGRLPNTTGEQTLHGLQFQWFAVLQGRLLTALSGPMEGPA